MAGTLSWQGSAVAVDGGYRVNGRWQFASGVDPAEWVMLGCADPQSHNPRVHVVIPVGDLEIDDTWHAMGLQGTGSKDVVAHEVSSISWSPWRIYSTSSTSMSYVLGAAVIISSFVWSQGFCPCHSSARPQKSSLPTPVVMGYILD